MSNKYINTLVINRGLETAVRGTIIKYKVNAETIVNFHVIFDFEDYMESQRNIVDLTPWYFEALSSNGPVTILSAL